MSSRVEPWISDLVRRRAWRLVRPLAAGGAEIAGTTPAGLRWTCRADPVQGDRILPVPGVEFRCQDVSADDVRWLVVEREQSAGVTVATSSPGAEGDLAVVTVAGLAWILRRLRRTRRSEGASATAGEVRPSSSIMGPGWTVLDPAGIIDAVTAGLLRGADVAPGGATIAVHLNQHGLHVASGHWWNDAARLEHLVECGMLLSDRARARGARPSS